ncbi:MAG: hypothetical protein J3K34DRAFT_409085 [Monoraphidium minutum]|nr:MAG: hypothetical protein J3K34DRAFT_409085 [Monoraphidium minutum]
MEVDEVHQPGTSQQQQAGGSEQGKQEPRQQQQDAASRRYGDATCGYGSDDEPPTFSDAEDAAIGAGAAGRAAGAWEQRQSGAGSGGGAGADEGQVAAWRERFRSNAGGLADLERVASAATALLMDAQGALGCLCGRNGRYLVRRTAVTLGRSTDSKGDVDVDLAREGVPGKVSRLQAQLALGRGGGWSVKNVGRRELFVNGAPLERGESAPVPHLSLLEVGGVQLLFMANPAAVQRALVRSQQLVM